MMVALLAVCAMTQSSQSVALVRVPITLEASEGLGAVAVSKPVDPGFDWDEAIISWNAAHSENAKVEIRVQALREGRESAWYPIALWHGDMARGPRSSVASPADADGEVLTDVLRMKSPFRAARIEVDLQQVSPGSAPKLKLLTICFSKREAMASENSPSGPALPIEVPQIAQGPYEHGKLEYPKDRVSPEFEDWFNKVKGAQYCSPTALAMVLQHWSKKLNRPELGVSVPQAVAGVFDVLYPGTGNWSFNVAFAGSFPGMQAYVTRLRGVRDVEELVGAGIPVVCSVSHNLVLGNGKPAGGDGHLVVIVGFEKNGDPIANDPGISEQVRRTYTRADFVKGWATSGRTVYLCHPDKARLPASLSGVVISN